MLFRRMQRLLNKCLTTVEHPDLASLMLLPPTTLRRYMTLQAFPDGEPSKEACKLEQNAWLNRTSVT